MTTSLTWQEYCDLFQEADKKELGFDVSDELDTVWQYDGRIAKGQTREVRLREGIVLEIGKVQNRDRVLLNVPEQNLSLQWHFMLSGKQQNIYSSSHSQSSLELGAGQYVLFGKGVEQITEDWPDTESCLEVTIHVQPEVLCSFVSDSSGELPKIFHHLVQPRESGRYKRAGEIPPMAIAVLQQILQCSYKGLTKRMLLEGKATELMALILEEEEAAFQQGELKKSLLQPDQLDRIHYAKEILLKNLVNPPSLTELSRQAGTCEYNLKRGFKEVFGTTVFGYLRDRRLEKAQALLLEQKMSVASVAQAVGYDSRASFTTAFKRKYGVSPKAYQISARK
ncbi:MAG: helix-turn-helix transcriptional regulator [Leptolyngbya sp. SIO4C1]|nr:helix-turn-helix transcriptional regulator [Leptolyngbya sp. SIO4C1]